MSVGPTRGPVRRPGFDRDIDELLQRVEDLERNRPGGDYVFVEAQNESGTAAADFQDIPHDARHLEIFGVGFGDMNVQFNGDTADHYRDLSHIVEDDDGVTADTVVSSGGYGAAIVVRNIDDTAGSAATKPYRFRMVVPYYAAWPRDFGYADRSCEIHAWKLHVEPPDVDDLMRTVTTAGWWDTGGSVTPQAVVPPPAIERVRIFSNAGGGGFMASLYKIL